MKSGNSLGDAMLRLLESLRKSESEEERRILEIASGAAAFLSRSGQRHRFEDFNKAMKPGPIPSVSFAEEIRFLEHWWARAPSASEKDSLLVAIRALAYIESSGQREALDDYLVYWRNSTLPPVIAVFQTRDEAEAWMDAQLPPPTMASILIADSYHLVLASRERREPLFARVPIVAEFIEGALDNGLPPAVASFETREQAEAWHASVPDPPRHAFITIQGEHHVAAYWKNVNHRALYPFTLADELKKERRERDERLAHREKDEGE
ncbi:MAG TPA: hypothetical protein VFZ09_38610 [Archangium sp.]|uniref:hypothetical protein n=1 Tax=Archangium sp. TaxID=1872627 RepID=UPI002E3450AC|nr:hypothetical protein [Archangium sp.]HEX5752190.1 hypothetical protein [Archangium sp.]